MQKSKCLIYIALICLWVLPNGAMAQGGSPSSINAFSPYTFYGVGDLSVQGSTLLRSMGGIGAGYNNVRQMNYLNPAAFSMVNPKSALFTVGLENQNYYSKTASQSTSYNSFNIRDVGLQLPIAKNMGIGFSVTPLSNVGYRVDMVETDPAILANIGRVAYNYWGDGGITQFKLGYGVQLFKGLSLGGDAIYYHGQITRTFNQTIDPLLDASPIRSSVSNQRENYSRFGMNFGFQYALINKEARTLTLGATYQPRLNLRPKTSRQTVALDVFQDTIISTQSRINTYLPGQLRAGLYYQTPKLGVGLDYALAQWSQFSAGDPVNGVAYRDTHAVMAGVQYTPNANDARNFLRRWTYRAGVRYNTFYMQMNGQNIDDKAITLGLGIPLKQGLSNINVGFEVGQRGSTSTGVFGTKQFQMLKERYFKVSIGLTLFGEDYWFVKYKYD